MRLSALDKPGVLAKISGILSKHRISIALVSQKMQKAEKVVPVIMMTHEALERNMAKALKEIDALGVIKNKTVCVRVEE
jgi:homoserine dehydrogenase